MDDREFAYKDLTDDFLKEVIVEPEPIMSERTERYKRNMLIMAAILIGMHIDGVSFTSAKFLGVELSHKSFLVGAFLALAYNSYFARSLSQEDWWRFVANYKSVVKSAPILLVFWKSDEEKVWFKFLNRWIGAWINRKKILKRDYFWRNRTLHASEIIYGADDAHILFYDYQVPPLRKKISRFAIWEIALPFLVSAGGFFVIFRHAYDEFDFLYHFFSFFH